MNVPPALRLVVGFSPGSASDDITRLVAAPQVPTLAEAGVTGAEMFNRVRLVAARDNDSGGNACFAAKCSTLPQGTP